MIIHFKETCHYCDHLFIWSIPLTIFVICDINSAQLEYRMHVADCVNNRVEAVLTNGGVS